MIGGNQSFSDDEAGAKAAAFPIASRRCDNDDGLANALGDLNVEQGYGDGAFNPLPDPEDTLNGVASVVVGDGCATWISWNLRRA